MKQELKTRKEKVHKDIFKLIQDSNTDAVMITYKLMQKIGFFNTDKLSQDGVESERIPLATDELLLFRVIMEQGAKVNLFVHDCKKHFFVKSGMIEISTLKRKLKAHDTDMLFPQSKHGIYAHLESEFYLLFIKPENE